MDIHERDSQKNKMSNTSRIEIEKFSGHNFELWKLKMEDLLVDQEHWVVVKLGTILAGMSNEHWMKLYKKAQSTIQLCLTNLVLLNVLEEDTMKKLWEKVGNLYQSK